MTITIKKGKTFSRVLRPTVLPYIYRAITAITKAAPAQITATGHGAVTGQEAAIVSVKGMTQINAKDSPPRDEEYHAVTVIDPNTVSINDINAAEFSTYTSGGYLQFKTPVAMAGATVRRSIKNRLAAQTANLWRATTVYAAGAYVVIANGSVLQASVGGTSASVQPTGASTDGSVTWIATVNYAGSRELLRLDSGLIGGIVVDNVNHTITETISAVVTAAITWKTGVTDLEMEIAGVVTEIEAGNVVAVEDEVTT